VRRPLAIAAAAALGLASPSGAQLSGPGPHASAAPAFSGRYKLVLTVSRGCPAAVQVGPQSVLVDLSEAPVAAGSEVSGQSANPAERPEDVRFVLLRQVDALHGPFGASDAAYVGFRTLEGYRIWMRIMAEGTAAAAGSRSQAGGKAFGEIDLSRPGDTDVDTIGFCEALDHAWSLEPA
jgi:hypothetical protein